MAAAAALVLGGSAGAHEFWIQPGRFWVAPGAGTSLAVLVGHGTDRERWRLRLRRVVRFASIAPDGTETDRHAALSEAPGAPDTVLTFDMPGQHVVVLETNDAFSGLPADKFAAYLAEEGLTPAIEARRREGTAAEAGRERYSRRAKALVQVGAPGRATGRATRPLGMTLEITPEVDPYRAGRAARLPVRVTYRSAVLPGATVRLTNLDADAAAFETRITDTHGRAVFTLPRGGRWQLGTVWTRRIRGDAEADFETIFSSLAFGFPR